MNIFLDTSSLFKLYHEEPGTETIDNIFIDNKIIGIFLSEIAKVEFASTIWKKVRLGEINESQAIAKMKLFEADFPKYTFVQIDSSITNHARNLITKYGKQGLRTLDSIQLSTSVYLINQCSLFITTDKLLNNLFAQESLPTK